MSEMKLIMENWDKFLLQEAEPASLETYGDLRKQLMLAKSAKNKDEFKSFALGAAMSFLGIDTAISGVQLLRRMAKTPDNKKTNTVLDTFLNIDDQASKIVDDTVENNFLNYFIGFVQEQDPERRLEQDNITQHLIKYISDEYKGRTLEVPGAAV